MLKYSILLLSLLISGAVSYTLVNGAENTESKTLSELQNLVDKYGNSTVKALYSLEETRAYSIIHVDKVSEIYQNKWLSPDSVVSILEPADTERLLTELSKVIDGFSIEKRRKVIDKIRFWSITDLHFSFIMDVYEIYPDRLMKILSDHDKTAFLFFHLDKQGRQGFDSLTWLEKNESYYKSLNLISGLKLPEQYLFYSDLYQELAVLAYK